MTKQSAGILLYRFAGKQIQFFLVHPGGPFYKNKDNGHWSVPKGEFDETEQALAAAKREFEEETGRAVDGQFIELKPVKLKSGKLIHLWAVEGDIDHLNIRSNLFEMEWPPRSGRTASFPEVDRAGWFEADAAKVKLNPAYAQAIEQLVSVVLK